MSLEDRGAQHDKEIVDKFHSPNAAYAMSTYDYVMRPSANGVSGAIILTLPPVAEAKGRFYSFVCRQADAVNTVTITDRDDSECWVDDIVFDGKCDRALLYSDGLCWQPCGGGPGTWPGAETTPAPGTTGVPTTLADRTTAAPDQTTVVPTT